MEEILINPEVPEWMDDKDINDRSESHMEKWFGKAYIRTQGFTEDNYTEYVERMKDCGPNYQLETEQEFNNRRKQNKEEWFTSWPDGVRYDVRCLDGGAWDRTTNKGHYKTLEEAKAKCKEIMEK